MIVCSCNVLNDSELRGAIRACRASVPEAEITPGRVVHALGGRIRCQGCLGLLFEIIEDEGAGSSKRSGKRRKRT